MPAQLINGKAISQEILGKLKQARDRFPTQPGLAVILVGNDPASNVYIKNKQKACDEVGILSQKIVLPETTTPEELFAVIDRLNRDATIHGILCQFPLPGDLKTLEEQVIRRINPLKDVDGLHPLSPLAPCTPQGVMVLIESTGIPIRGTHAVIVGRSRMGGKPIANLLLNADATVTITHSKTKNIKAYTQTADILVSSVGLPRLITADMVKPGAIVIDVGINRTETGIVGDVDFESVCKVASFITPVPGGVGPMTIAMLIENVIAAYRLQSLAPAAFIP